MAGQTEFGDDPLAPGCYSQLLFGDEISGLETEDGCFGFTNSSFSSDDNTNLNSPKMLCFGDYAKQCGGNGKKTEQKPGLTCMDPPPKIINVGAILLCNNISSFLSECARACVNFFDFDFDFDFIFVFV